VDVGSYSIGKEFGSDAKPFTIGEKRKEPIRRTVGPGDYEPTRADSVTRSKSRTTLIVNDKSPSRAIIAIPSQVGSTGPGQYDEKRKFGDDAKPF
jgi:hypothetical protein